MTNVPVSSYSYDLPESRIAQRPVHPYDRAKLLLVDRSSGQIGESLFYKLAGALMPGDTLVFNDSKVIPARLFGEIEGSRNQIEVLLLEERASDVWLCIGRPLKRFKPQREILFTGGLFATVLERVGEQVLLQFGSRSGAEAVKQQLFSHGMMPIPPYIRSGRSDEDDRRDYQSIFARAEGSIAAPTASLHFTEELLNGLRSAGCHFAFITLHVGAASITPLWREGQLKQSTFAEPAAERYVYDPELLSVLKKRREEGARVVAVGTTAVRALESMVREPLGGEKIPVQTPLFITPGFEFRLVDALITNFHQPATTHLLLVEAFMKSRGLLERAYGYALENEFRFLSYGDGMLIT